MFDGFLDDLRRMNKRQVRNINDNSNNNLYLIQYARYFKISIKHYSYYLYIITIRF